MAAVTPFLVLAIIPLDVRAERSAREEWYSVGEEALVAYEENIFAALVGPSDPVRYEAMFPRAVERLRETAGRHHSWLQSVGHTRPRPSAAAARMPSPYYGRGSSGGLHCRTTKRLKS
jgi:hypothetical protein